MRRPVSRVVPALAALALAFGMGVASQHLGVREAHAQPAPAMAATVYVPGDGLMFKTADGRPLARLSRDASGGVFELYDDRGLVAQRVSAGSVAATWTAPSPKELHPNPYATDADPFEAPAAAHVPRPSPGF
jgi:hypothetical protein